MEEPASYFASSLISLLGDGEPGPLTYIKELQDGKLNSYSKADYERRHRLLKNIITQVINTCLICVEYEDGNSYNNFTGI